MRTGSFRKGSKLGKYRLDRRLGSGSFATVWKARDTVLNRFVALKIVDPLVEEECGRIAIEREARIGARLSHANIVSVRNADWIDGRFVLATDLAERSLADYPGARRSPRIALRVIRDVAAGLAHAHSRRVLHLDIKPENILIFPDGRAAIADFGTSRLARRETRTFIEAGTLGYMAPEQAYGRARLTSDVFSLGLIAYELLTGKLLSWPFTWPPQRHARFVERVPPPLLPVLRRAAAFQPRRRYADAIDLHRAMEAAFLKTERSAPRNGSRRRARIEKKVPPALAVAAETFRKRHGAALGMRYRCFHCDGPIAESMSHCPWCGTPDNSFREVTSLPLVCPECERGVRPEWKACPWCYPGRFVGNGKTQRVDPAADRKCSRRGCEGRLRPFMRYCPLCKTRTRRLWSHAELADRCPKCRWPVSRDYWHYCPWCGRHERAAGTFVRRRRSR